MLKLPLLCSLLLIRLNFFMVGFGYSAHILVGFRLFMLNALLFLFIFNGNLIFYILVSSLFILKVFLFGKSVLLELSYQYITFFCSVFAKFLSIYILLIACKLLFILRLFFSSFTCNILIRFLII